jgi:type IV secretory pathway VirB3-like protein
LRLILGVPSFVVGVLVVIVALMIVALMIVALVVVGLVMGGRLVWTGDIRGRRPTTQQCQRKQHHHGIPEPVAEQNQHQNNLPNAADRRRKT